MKYLILVLMVCGAVLQAQEYPALTAEELAAMDRLGITLVMPKRIVPELIIPEITGFEYISTEIFNTLFLPAGFSYAGVNSAGVKGTKTYSAKSKGTKIYSAKRKYVRAITAVRNGTQSVSTDMILASLKDILAFRKSTKFIKDRYTRSYDKDFNKYNKILNKWAAISKVTFPLIKYVPYTDTHIKMIAEIRSDGSIRNLKNELSYYKANGYNAVLVCWRGESVYKLLKYITIAKGLGFKIWFTYGGKESVRTSVYIEPEKYGERLQELAELCDGFLLGWRRTSLHLFIPEKTWTGYTLDNVRKANPNIYIFGEIYFDYNANTLTHGDIAYNIPANVSGVLTANVGNGNSNAQGIMKLVRKKTSLPLINIIVGEKPYYMSRNNTNRTEGENRSIVTQIEKRFIRAGFSGTITISGDGSDGNYTPVITDNIVQSGRHVKTENN